jgi:iron complex transport system substrate-binding protein
MKQVWLKGIICTLILLFCFSALALRIVSLSPYLTESLLLLGAEDELVGITSVGKELFGIEGIEVIGDTLNVNIEKIYALKPDMVLVTPMNKVGTIQKLEDLGLKVLYFELEEDFQQCCESFRRLAKLIGKERRAEEIIEEAREKLDRVQKLLAEVEPKRVFVEIQHRPLITVGGDCYLNEMVRYARGINLTHDLGRGFFRISLEKVLELDPEVIISLSPEEENLSISDWGKFGFIKAVSEKRIYFLNPDPFSRPNPSNFVKGVYLLVKVLHGLSL